MNFSSITMCDEGEYRCEAVNEDCNNDNQITFITVHCKASYRVALCYQLCYQFFLSLNESYCFSANVDEQLYFYFLK